VKKRIISRYYSEENNGEGGESYEPDMNFVHMKKQVVFFTLFPGINDQRALTIVGNCHACSACSACSLYSPTGL
jgi:hypothetical protein